jgi:Fe-Mn family superoxide dismutase
VKRLNAITAQLATLDVATVSVFVINGLMSEELIAENSMIIHELHFDSLAGEGEPTGAPAAAMIGAFGGLARRQAEFAATGAADVDAFMQGIRWSNAQALYDRYARET